MKRLVWLKMAALVLMYLLSASASAVTLTMLPVGDPGNAVDPRPFANLGAVNYTYWLDKYDVTNAQYVEFLNAKASVADPYGLYDLDMADSFGQGGITRLAGAPYAFAVKSGYENKPVIAVSWFDAIRFANWLTNGQGNGDTESGSYLITGGGPNSGTAIVPDAAQRALWSATSRHYLLPSADEWYKAAFYKGGGTSAGYWNYPLSSNTRPNGGPPGNVLYTANVLDDFGNFAVPGPIQLTDVGAYSSKSPYGHSDMAGNVFQFTDTPYQGDPAEVGLRGSPFGISEDGTIFQSSSHYIRTQGVYELGFRIAMVPEPASVTLAAVALGGLLAASYRRRRRAELG